MMEKWVGILCDCRNNNNNKMKVEKKKIAWFFFGCWSKALSFGLEFGPFWLKLHWGIVMDESKISEFCASP